MTDSIRIDEDGTVKVATTTATGKELAYQVLDVITALHEQREDGRRLSHGWDQSIWRMVDMPEVYGCGTAMCFAGWSAELSGARWSPSDDMEDFIDCGRQEATTASEWARDRLRLTVTQACDLFRATNTLDDIRAHILRIYGPREVS